ncbi:hypothetical protein ABZV92_18695 [Streptomyces rubiginosohelvolus]|uniref:hypothetical protein n=1 Tax=Streptomyces rubiginosohelvolus TaxID=67362 RepID=UPI0033B26411
MPNSYTTADLRAEAANQHYNLTCDPDHMGVGESMSTTTIPSTGQTLTWGQLLPADTEDGEAYGAAVDDVHRLIDEAANVSAWAVEIGADGLRPSRTAITLSGVEQPLARVHFAFAPDMTPEMQSDLITSVNAVLAQARFQNGAPSPRA